MLAVHQFGQCIQVVDFNGFHYFIFLTHKSFPSSWAGVFRSLRTSSADAAAGGRIRSCASRNKSSAHANAPHELNKRFAKITFFSRILFPSEQIVDNSHG